MYKIKGRQYDEDPNEKLGQGSEGAVYPFPPDKKLCVKLFHDSEPGDKSAATIADYRARKIQAICALGLHMSSHFAMPLEPAFDGRGKVKGFLMPKVKPGFVKILELLKQQWRVANNVGLKEIVLLFSRIFGEDLKEIERNGLAIGDVNAGCVMIDPQLDRCFVDTDSDSYPGFPCLATTELYAHPELYANLDKNNKGFVNPTITHDRFAFTVMFTQMALNGAHPFRMGTHTKFTSPRERTSNGVTIFDKGITYPKLLPPPEILSDELLHALIQILKRKDNGTGFDKDLLTFASMLTTCQQCGADYAASRSNCPKCHEKTFIDMTKLVKLLIKTLYSSSATMLRVQMVGKEIRTVCQVNGMVHICIIDELGNVRKIPTDIPATRGAKYLFFADNLVVTRNPYAPPPVALELYCIAGQTIKRISDASTGSLEGGQALVQTSERFLYRTAGNTLMCARMFGPVTLMEERVAQVHQTQTWFTVDRSAGTEREALFGYDRALRDMQWFVIEGDKEGNRFSYHDVKLSPMKLAEKLVDFAVYFSKEFVMLVRKTGRQGKEYVRYSLIRLKDGHVEKDELLGESDTGFDSWENISGKLFQGESVLHVTPKGVVKQVLATNQYTHLEETEGVVTITDQLFRCGTKVGVARSNAILTFGKK